VLLFGMIIPLVLVESLWVLTLVWGWPEPEPAPAQRRYIPAGPFPFYRAADSGSGSILRRFPPRRRDGRSVRVLTRLSNTSICILPSLRRRVGKPSEKGLRSFAVSRFMNYLFISFDHQCRAGFEPQIIADLRPDWRDGSLSW
jgi:hypothetical protein